MLQVKMPQEVEIAKIQKIQNAFYWSACIDMVLQKHGIVTRLEEPSGDAKIYSVITRGNIDVPKVGFCEGPLTESQLCALGLEVAAVSSSRITISGQEGLVGELVYGRFLVKKIPKNKNERTTEHEYVDEDPRWHTSVINCQYFLNLNNDWETIATANIEGVKDVPIVVRRRNVVVSGCPLFDVFGFNHAMPALDKGFYRSHFRSYQFPVERWLANLLKDHAEKCGLSVSRKPLWPNGAQAALSVRHDYDRPITMARLKEMLAFYAKNEIRATWFLLVGKKMPEREQVNAMLALGHEVALHTVASTLTEFIEEIIAFRKATGVTPMGFTCHGGLGSSGHLALTHNTWALQAGMLYGEMIGRCRGIPHPLVVPTEVGARSKPFVVQNCHFSLDVNTKPEGHQLEKLSRDIPLAIKAGEHVIIMQHPDIHWNELRVLLGSLQLDGIYKATMKAVAAHIMRKHS